MPNYTITGSDDEPQLVVIGYTTQTEALQEWQDSSGEPLARLTGDGRLQVGSFDSGVMATDESLIEAHRAENDTSKPKRGFHLMGAITGVLSTAVSWVVQELTLKGTNGVAAMHTALRVRLRNEATGTPVAGGELRGGDIEVMHAGGAAGSPLSSVTGLRVAVNQEAGASSAALHGVKVEVPAAASGIYALHTTGGKIHFGGLGAGALGIDANGDLTSVATTLADVVLLEHRLANGTGGGSATAGSWETRPVNTEVIDTGTIASISSNLITLEAGTYQFRINTAHYSTNRTAIRLYNTTTSAILQRSLSALFYNTSSVGGIITMDGYFTLAAQSVLRIEQRVQTSVATSGMGVAASFGDQEVHLQAMFRRVAY